MYVRNDVVLDDASRKALELAIDDRSDGTRVRRAILVLNHPALVAARAAAIDSERKRIEKTFSGRRAASADREQQARQMLVKNPLPSYVSVRIAWLRKT